MNQPFQIEVRKKDNFTDDQLIICRVAAQRHKERQADRKKAIRSMAQRIMVNIAAEAILEDGISAGISDMASMTTVAEHVVAECAVIYDAIGSVKIEDRYYADTYPA